MRVVHPSISETHHHFVCGAGDHAGGVGVAIRVEVSCKYAGQHPRGVCFPACTQTMVLVVVPVRVGVAGLPYCCCCVAEPTRDPSRRRCTDAPPEALV